MQNWDSALQQANYEHNWYSNMFQHIKTEPQSRIPPSPQQSQSLQASSTTPPLTAMDHFFNIKQHQQQTLNMTSSLTPSPRTDSNEGHNFFDTTANTTTPSNGLANHNSGIQNNNILLQQHQQQHPLGFNPLTPPGLPNAILPQINFHNHDLEQIQNGNGPNPPSTLSNQLQQQQQQQQQHPQEQTNSKIDNNNSLTPRNTPPMDITPPKSPKNSYNSSSASDYLLDKDQEIISNSSDLVDESEDDDTIRMPIYNSHGKMKNYKCRTCGYLAITKIAFWQHARVHMKPEKLLQCPKCPFVTELKHHLEYHIRKHKNLKPFQCDKCNYSCVNKSMLNSHLKSHSSVYQYRCTDCDYATKYCHSFKLHLRKYDHKPGLVLDEEGLPNPSVIIDVYGTRRGPKSKSGGGGSRRGRVSKSHARLSALSAQTKLFLNQQQQQQQKTEMMSPIKTEIPTVVIKNEVQQQHRQPQQQQPTGTNLQNFLPNPLANMLQQQRNISSFFPYWNLNLQMLAAQQQAVLAQLSPRMREAAIQSLNINTTSNNNNDNNIHGNHHDKAMKKLMLDDHDDANNNKNMNGDFIGNYDDDEDYDENDNIEEIDDNRSDSSVMDLSSQGTPTKSNTNDNHLLKKFNNNNDEINTPTISSSSSRRKGRVLKLDTILQNKESPNSSNDDSFNKLNDELNCSTTTAPNATTITQHHKRNKSNENESPSSSSGNNHSDDKANFDSIIKTNISSIGTAASAAATTNNHHQNIPQLTGIFECKYCDIYFKDAVLYTIHMGYHSCDDVFKCNMCGEKCDGPVGLFVHMARNAHS